MPVANGVERSGAHRSDIGRDARRGFEVPLDRAAPPNGRAPCRPAVRHDFPPFPPDHSEVERPLEVGLIEAGEHPVGAEGLEVSVEVHLAIDRILEAVHTDLCPVVPARRRDAHLVLRFQSLQDDTVPIEGPGRDVAAVHLNGADLRGGEVQERLPAWCRATEADDRLRPQPVVPGQVQPDLVAEVLDQAGPPASFLSCLVVLRHDIGSSGVILPSLPGRSSSAHHPRSGA